MFWVCELIFSLSSTLTFHYTRLLWLKPDIYNSTYLCTVNIGSWRTHQTWFTSTVLSTTSLQERKVHIRDKRVTEIDYQLKYQLIFHSVQVGILPFSCFWKTIVSFWKRRRKIENETIVFIKLVVSLMFVNEERKMTWRPPVLIIE